jgi:hypothetical protein
VPQVVWKMFNSYSYAPNPAILTLLNTMTWAGLPKRDSRETIKMDFGKYTIIYEKDTVRYKLFKVFYGRDGSYYVTSPYHPERTAALIKSRINYSLGEMHVAHEDLVEVAGADDDQERIKLAHHPDGFVQFSGQGVLSGREPDGTIRGIGVVSWPLDRPMLGPAFGVGMRGVEHFSIATGDETNAVVFNSSALTPVPEPNILLIEGYYFPSRWRRFVQVAPHGTRTISIVHPARAVVTLRVLLPAERCARANFIGLECYTFEDEITDHPSPSFSMSSPAGEIRENLEGEITGANLHCMYPRMGTLELRRSVNYYGMNEVPIYGVNPARVSRPLPETQS